MRRGISTNTTDYPGGKRVWNTIRTFGRRPSWNTHRTSGIPIEYWVSKDVAADLCVTHALDLATGRHLDAFPTVHFHKSTRAISPTYRLPMPSVLDLLAPLALLLFDTLLTDIPYFDVAASTLPPYASGDHDLDEPRQRYRALYPASSCLLLVFYLLSSTCNWSILCYGSGYLGPYVDWLMVRSSCSSLRFTAHTLGNVPCSCFVLLYCTDSTVVCLCFWKT